MPGEQVSLFCGNYPDQETRFIAELRAREAAEDLRGSGMVAFSPPWKSGCCYVCGTSSLAVGFGGKSCELPMGDFFDKSVCGVALPMTL
jgi:hypothetical protein